MSILFGLKAWFTHVNKSLQVLFRQRRTRKRQTLKWAKPQDVACSLHVHNFKRNLWTVSKQGLKLFRLCKRALFL